MAGSVTLAVPDTPTEGFVGGLDAHLAGLCKQFASQTDVCLLVEGQQIRVHSALLAVHSSVFADIFSTAQAENAAAMTSKDAKLCVTMAGHTVSDTCSALEYLYQRSSSSLTNTPSKQLWQSINKGFPVITFAHKFDMKDILEECDTCLSEKAQEKQGKLIFSSTDVTIAWAALADDCGLKRLSSEVELFMLKCSDTKFWQSDSFAAYQLGQASLLRVLRAAQHERAALKAHIASHMASITCEEQATFLETRCKSRSTQYHRGWCRDCCPPSNIQFVASQYMSSETLLNWQ